MGSSAPGLRFLPSRAPRYPVFPPSFLPPSATRAAIPSCASILLQGLLSKSSLPSLDGRTSHGLPCRSAHAFRRSPRTPRASKPRVRVRVQGLSPSSRLAPPSALRVYFTPLTPFGFPFRGFPSRGATPALRGRRAVLPFFRRLRTHRLGTVRPSAHQLPFLGTGQVPLAGFTALLPSRVRARVVRD